MFAGVAGAARWQRKLEHSRVSGLSIGQTCALTSYEATNRSFILLMSLLTVKNILLRIFLPAAKCIIINSRFTFVSAPFFALFCFINYRDQLSVLRFLLLSCWFFIIRITLYF